MQDMIFKVCVRCVTFNQAKYIVDAMDGFCIQETNFPYICCIIDDASTDNEQDTIKKYLISNFQYIEKDHIKKKEYGELIVTQHKTNKNCYFAVFLLDKNHYQNGNNYKKNEYIRPWMENAKYIAMCEGDDYWTNPQKLQKQVDFLETHPDYVLCFHKCNILEETEISTDFLIDHNGTSTIKDLAEGNYIHTVSALYRTNPYIATERSKLPLDLVLGDYILWMLLAQYGKIMKLPECMAIYRMGSGTWSSQKRSFTVPKSFMVQYHLIRYFEERNPEVSKKMLDQLYKYIQGSLEAYEADIKYYKQFQDGILQSRKYKIGNFILQPIEFLINIVKHLKNVK